MHLILRTVVVAAAIFLWFWSQKAISLRPDGKGAIGDKLHEWTAGLNARLHQNLRAQKILLVISSAFIDLLGLFLVGSAIFGDSFAPFLGLFFLFALRQLSQMLTALPPPQGMIWKDPGVPSLFVTYGVANDLFFSGHTAIAVYGALEVARLGILPLTVAAIAIAAFEMATVIVLRAHWTMDVFTGAVTALWIAGVIPEIAPAIDRLVPF